MWIESLAKFAGQLLETGHYICLAETAYSNDRIETKLWTYDSTLIGIVEKATAKWSKSRSKDHGQIKNVSRFTDLLVEDITGLQGGLAITVLYVIAGVVTSWIDIRMHRSTITDAELFLIGANARALTILEINAGFVLLGSVFPERSYRKKPAPDHMFSINLTTCEVHLTYPTFYPVDWDCSTRSWKIQHFA